MCVCDCPSHASMSKRLTLMRPHAWVCVCFLRLHVFMYRAELCILSVCAREQAHMSVCARMHSFILALTCLRWEARLQVVVWWCEGWVLIGHYFDFRGECVGEKQHILAFGQPSVFRRRPYEHHRMMHARVKTTLMCGLITVDSVKAITQ